jgi:hypothetical protein
MGSAPYVAHPLIGFQQLASFSSTPWFGTN